ncbi:hypothetical protein HPB47_003878 [Ixodes persulcatus]|uniref:Uncharacterized protein n=1 Tax=Ixodes persulcatus TaxID=34615 RepID=A0AC60PIW3_IXOPE|nr:hypothetical protein HPB47_003878 [Ixodes persulcatus]
MVDSYLIMGSEIVVESLERLDPGDVDVPTARSLELSSAHHAVQSASVRTVRWAGLRGCAGGSSHGLSAARPRTPSPEPFRGNTLEDRHPQEPVAVYNEAERRLLCPVCGVPEIHRLTLGARCGVRLPPPAAGDRPDDSFRGLRQGLLP